MNELIYFLKNRLQEPLPHRSLDLEPNITPELARFVQIAYDHRMAKNQLPRVCSVMLSLFEDDGEVILPFMQRPDKARVHPSQIVFPGGGREDQDQDLIATAQREMQEEVGIIVPRTQVIGSLSDIYVVPSNSMVTPMVSFLNQRPSYNLDTNEVSGILEFRLKDLLDPRFKSKHAVLLPNGNTIYMPAFQIGETEIWGATARMLSELLILVEEFENVEYRTPNIEFRS